MMAGISSPSGGAHPTDSSCVGSRLALDGIFYTAQDFQEWYGLAWQDIWNESRTVSEQKKIGGEEPAGLGRSIFIQWW